MRPRRIEGRQAGICIVLASVAAMGPIDAARSAGPPDGRPSPAPSAAVRVDRNGPPAQPAGSRRQADGSRPRTTGPDAAGSGGQSPEKADPPAQTPRSDAPADQPALTASHVGKARQLIFAIGVPDAFEVASSDAMAQIAAAMTQSHPDLAADMNVVMDQLRPEVAKQTDDMIDVTARFYASVFSESEIDTILAFFNSEAGRKWNAAQRDIYKQLTSGIQAWQQKVIVTMVARVRQEMKKKGHDL